MPVHKTKSGAYKWGSHGKAYYGPNAKQKAAAQGRAAYAAGYKGHSHAKAVKKAIKAK